MKRSHLVLMSCGAFASLAVGTWLVWRSPSVAAPTTAPAPQVLHPTLDDADQDRAPSVRARRVLSEYLAAAREWKRHPENSEVAGAKQAWLDALVGIVRSVDPVDLPEGLLLTTINLARELGDADTAIEVSLVAAQNGATPTLRLHGAVQYAELSGPDPSAGGSARLQYAQSLAAFTSDALVHLSSVTDEDAGWVLAMTEALAWQATEALRAAGKGAEAAELQEKAAPIVAGQAEAQLHRVPDSMRADEAYERVAGLWISAGDEDRAFAMLEAIDAMTNPRRSASEHVLNVVSHSREGTLTFETGIAERWMETHPTWATTADIRLAQALVLQYAQSSERAADAVALGEKILNDHPELLRQADEDVAAQLRANAKEWAGKTNVSAEVLQAMSIAARRLGDRDLADRYRDEFVARFPDHPSNKIRAAKGER